MITITLPDGNKKDFIDIPTGFDVAKSISEGLARDCVAMEIDGRITDLAAEIMGNARVRFITRKDPEGLGILRHSAAHVMAQAVTDLYPDAKLTIGPVVEDGFYYDIDMPPVSEEDFPKIEKRIQEIIKAKLPFKRKAVSNAEAQRVYENEPYKLELISDLAEGAITLYEQGDFTDLCRGPHLPHTGHIKAIKLMKVSGAYWRADPKKAQLQRIYGTAFFSKQELDAYLTFLEEAKRRNHRKIGAALDLYSFHDEAAGMPFFHPKGMVIWNMLLEYWREAHTAAGYLETKTPIMLTRELWERSGHLANYGENMYFSKVEDYDYAIKPMNCPGGMLLFARKPTSYKDLPIRAGEIGLVHRHEMSGVLNGLFRVRAFHQDDAHIFMTPEQIQDEILGVLNLIQEIYSMFGLGFHLELSTRPKKSIGTDEQWAMATDGLKAALHRYGMEYKVNEGDGAFYGPKIDVHIKDALGRTWQCGTIQLDMSLPERFDLTYTGKDNEKHRPIMIHRVIYGSIERFFGILVEHYAGKFPIWLSPVQVMLLPINDELISYTEEINGQMIKAGIRSEVDKRTESLNKKIREARLINIPMIVTIGHREQETGTVSVRTLDDKVHQGIGHQSFMEKVTAAIASRTQQLSIFE